MRKQLSQPSFVNGFARYPNESVRPDLLADHLWCPMLGLQDTLIGVGINKKNRTITNPRWASGYLYEDGASTSRIDLSDWLPFAGLSEVTIFSWIRLTSNSLANTHALWCAETTGGYVQFVLVSEPSGATHRFTFLTRDSSTGPTGARNNDISTGYSTLAGTWSLIAATYSVASKEKAIYVNGVKAASSTTSIDALTSAYTSSWINGSSYSYPYTIRADSKLFGIAFRAYTPSQIADLSADPLLPLRRKKIWSMYVPSTGGVFKPFWCHNPEIIGAA